MHWIQLCPFCVSHQFNITLSHNLVIASDLSYFVIFAADARPFPTIAVCKICAACAKCAMQHPFFRWCMLYTGTVRANESVLPIFFRADDSLSSDIKLQPPVDASACIILVVNFDFAIILRCKEHWVLCFSSVKMLLAQGTPEIKSKFDHFCKSIFIDIQHMKNGCFSSTKLIVGSILHSLSLLFFVGCICMCSCFCSRFRKCSPFLSSSHVADVFLYFSFSFFAAMQT